MNKTKMTKLERVKATLNHQPVDRAAVLEQLSYNPKVISNWTNKAIDGYNYTIDDICEVIRMTCDIAMPPVNPRGTAQFKTEDGFVIQNDNWTSWHISRPFDDVEGARQWLIQRTEKLQSIVFDAEEQRQQYKNYMLDLQKKIGDDTVILNFSWTGFSSCFDAMGLEIFTFLQLEHPDVLQKYMDISVSNELRRIHAVTDEELSPVILIPEDFATKHGPIFGPDILNQYHYPYIKLLADAWHEHNICVLYHSDGNWKKVIPQLKACNVDGFYCLELNCKMDIVDLKNTYPEMIWAGGIDGVDLMERGTPEQIKQTVMRHIVQTNALNTGGMFIATSSEINPPIPSENFRAMIEAVWELTNPDIL